MTTAEKHVLFVTSFPGEEVTIQLIKESDLSEQLLGEVKTPWCGKEFRDGIRVKGDRAGYTQIMSPSLFKFLHRDHKPELQQTMEPVIISHVYKVELFPDIPCVNLDGKNVDFFDHVNTLYVTSS